MSFYRQDDCENWPWIKIGEFVPSIPCQETDTLGGVYTNKPDETEEDNLMENLIRQLNNSVFHVGEYSIDTEGHSHRIEKLSHRGTAYIIKCLRQYAERQKIVEEYSENDQYADMPEYFVKILDVVKENK